MYVALSTGMLCFAIERVNIICLVCSVALRMRGLVLYLFLRILPGVFCSFGD